MPADATPQHGASSSYSPHAHHATGSSLPGSMNDSIDMALQQSAAAAAAAAAYSETATPRRGFNDCPGSVAEDTPASVQIINGGTGTVASDAGAASDAGGAGSDTASGGGLTAAAAAAAGPGITCMTFDRVQQYNAYTSMIETHYKFHHATHGRHERMRMGPWRTRKKGHQKATRPPLVAGDSGPWDGTAHTLSILDQKLLVAADQADMRQTCRVQAVAPDSSSTVALH